MKIVRQCHCCTSKATKQMQINVRLYLCNEHDVIDYYKREIAIHTLLDLDRSKDNEVNNE